VEPIFEELSHCASLHPDPHGEEDELDDTIFDVNDTTFDTFTGDENEEFSEVGRVRSDFINDNRFAPY
jgi:nucleotide-sensitive chloride channel 1A